jgi:hypothetical protein
MSDSALQAMGGKNSIFLYDHPSIHPLIHSARFYEAEVLGTWNTLMKSQDSHLMAISSFYKFLAHAYGGELYYCHIFPPPPSCPHGVMRLEAVLILIVNFTGLKIT